MMAKDWRGVSFAGGRIVLSGAKMATETKQERLATRWLRRAWEKMVDYAVITGRCSIPARLYAGREMFFRRHTWIPQAWAFSVSPLEEVQTVLAAVNGNLVPKQKAIAAYNGGKWKKVSVERRDERTTEREYKIIPPDVEKVELLPAPATPQQQQQQDEQRKDPPAK
jgi:capsid protein